MRQKIILPLAVLWISVSMPSYRPAPDIHRLIAGYSDAILYAALNDTSLNPGAFEIALKGQRILSEDGRNKKPGLLTIIDYSRPSTAERLFVIDLSNYSIIYKSLVAHGRNSGELYATKFSNRMQSYQSSLGFFITGDTYQGGQGYSMLLMGVDTGYNDNAVRRSVVMHGADYVSDNYIEKYGRAGRSFGCPALPVRVNKEIIDLICEGSVLYCYYPLAEYFRKSSVLAKAKISSFQ